jgi:hypothetical protein
MTIENLQKILNRQMVKILTYCKEKFHHTNQSLLDNLSEDEEGNVKYKDVFINQPQIDALTTQNTLLKSEITELSSLLDVINRESR